MDRIFVVNGQKKQGWHKFGSRHMMIDRNHDPLGQSIDLFLDTYGDAVVKAIRDAKEYRQTERITAFCEFFGTNSFAGWHDENDTKEVVLIDVNIHKKGIIPPRNFLKLFGHLRLPDVVYEGIFNVQFIDDVRCGLYPVNEGVVAKGVLPGKKPPHGLWMSKVKTQSWFDKLKKRSVENPYFASELRDNEREQSNKYIG